MMAKRMRKLTSLLIALMMLLALTGMAVAEENNGVSQTDSTEAITQPPATAVPVTVAPVTVVPTATGTTMIIPVTISPLIDTPVFTAEVPEELDVTAVPTEEQGAAGELDPTAEPDPTEEVDPTQEPDPTAEPEQAVARSVTITMNGAPGSFQYGETVAMQAWMSGFEDVRYTIFWECSENGIDDWTAAPGKNGTSTYYFTLDEQNALVYWRVVVEVWQTN